MTDTRARDTAELTELEPRLDKWIRTVGAVVAPTTILAAALYYFGYVSSRAQYEYFGVDVDTLGIGPQEYIMRSPPALFAPLLVLLILTLLLRQLDGLLKKRIASDLTAHAGQLHTDRTVATSKVGPPNEGEKAVDTPEDEATGHPRALQHVRLYVRGARLVGAVVLAAGVILLLARTLLQNWTLYDLITPLLLAGGAGLVAYAIHIAGLVQDANDSGSQRPPDTLAVRTGLLIAVILACLFWAIATIAQASGLSRAMERARHLDQLPSVILDTKENLFLRDPGIEPTGLVPQSDGQTFHFRYHSLRLLIVGKDRMFLVPDKWSASDSTLVVPLDGSVRVQFQFQNNPP
jgi:hypothetical protein